MSEHCCNYQRVASRAEKEEALGLGRCESCSRTETELAAMGRTLEICGVEHGEDIVTGERILLTIPLCNKCHAEHHLNARMHSDPCPFKARRSWEDLTTAHAPSNMPPQV